MDENRKAYLKEKFENKNMVPLSDRIEASNDVLRNSICLSERNRENFVYYMIYNKPNFIVFFGYDAEEELDKLKELEAISTVDDKDMLNLEKVIEQSYSWTENIVTNADASYATLKHIVQTRVGTVDVYLTFLEGTVNQDYIDYMHMLFYEAYENIKSISESIRSHLAQNEEEQSE